MSNTFVLIGGACDGMRVTLTNSPEILCVVPPMAVRVPPKYYVDDPYYAQDSERLRKEEATEPLNYRRHCVHSLGGDGGHDQITFYAMEGMTVGTALKYLLTAYPRPKEDPAT